MKTENTMTMREFSTWGRGPRAGVSGRVRVSDGEATIDRVIARLERETGLRACGGPRDEGSAVERGRVIDRQYAVTLGRPLRSGGYTPESEVWISIPVAEEV